MRSALLWLVACGGSSTPAPQQASPPPGKVAAATPEQCDRLLLHLVDLELARVGGPPPDEASKQAVIDSKRTEFNAVCVDQTPARRVECALSARDLDGVAKCDEAP